VSTATTAPFAAAAVDRENPWPGLTTFSEGQAAFFFGREEEVRELYRRVDRKALTVLFGQSGLGKSSLLQAGLFPRLREARFCPVYVRLDHAPDATSLTEQIKKAVFKETATMGTWTKAGSSAVGETLWEFFHHRDDHLRAPDGTIVTPVLIFDQFEELFTLGSAAEATRQRAAAFIAEIADLAENRPPAKLEARMEAEATAIDDFDFTRADYRVLITLREDYLPHLESLKGKMPSLMQNRMRLTRMKAAQALDAIVKPGAGLVSPEVAAAIAAFVAGRADLTEAEIEPSLLSLVCRELNTQRLTRGEAVIGASLLAGTRDTILQTFYERSLADQSAAVRNFIEDELLTESGHRENVALDRAQKRLSSAGADPAALDVLVNRRLLRIEERLDVRRIELTHDVLCGVVRASREVRREREAKEAAERELAATRAKEAAVQRSLWRARLVAVICLVMAVGAAGSALFGYFNLRRARLAEQEALQAEAAAKRSAEQAQAIQELSQQARTSAETLVTYLLEDFYVELEPIGRLDVVGELAKRAADYYHDLPVPLRSPTTVRNQALADARYATILVRQSKIDAAVPVVNESLHLFDRLRANGDDSDDLAIGYATALLARSNLIYSQGKWVEGAEPAQRAVDLLKPRATPTSSTLLWMSLAASFDRLGFMQLRGNDYNKAIENLESARSIYDHMAKRQPPVRTALTSYAASGAWLFEALGYVGRIPEAEEVARTTVSAAGDVLKANPLDRGALRAQALGRSDLAYMDIDRLKNDEGVKLMGQSNAAWQRLLELDPTNGSARHNLSVQTGYTAFGIGKTGRVEEADQVLIKGAEALDAPNMTGDDASGALFNLRIAITNETQAGRVENARRLAARADYFRKRWLENQPAESSVRKTAQAGRSSIQAELTVGSGDYAQGAKLAEDALALQRARVETTKYGQNEKEQMMALLSDQAAGYELRLGHYERAFELAREAVDADRALHPVINEDFRQLNSDLTMEAYALARLGRKPEALALIEPVVKFDRGLTSLGDEPLLRYELADALLAEAASQPPEGAATRAADLAEVDQLLAVLPQELKDFRPTKELLGYVADVKAMP
jgi:hypothetical protein